ncbi:apolipoprotein D [Cherax quadricarinatus]|nr:apolipoprotein D-like [Cherax quadricarinatus]
MMSVMGRSVSLVVVAVLIPHTAMQIFFLFHCPPQTAFTSFNVSLFLGKWYEIKRYFTLYEYGGRCNAITFTDKGNGFYGVLNEQIVLGSVWDTIEGEAALVSPGSGQATFSLNYSSLLFLGMGAVGSKGNYWVLSTDYVNYAIAWACLDMSYINTQMLWILMRKRHPDPQELFIAENVVRSLRLDASWLEPTDQTNCFIPENCNSTSEYFC